MIRPEDIHFKLATTQVDMMHVAAIRGICNLVLGADHVWLGSNKVPPHPPRNGPRLLSAHPHDRLLCLSVVAKAPVNQAAESITARTT